MLLAAGAVPLLIWGCDRVQMIHWVGSADLTIEFSAADGGTGGPIPSARIEILSDGGFCEEWDKQEFVLIADAGGVARKECRQSQCFGTQSGLRFTDTFAVHLPWWRYRVVADGFETGEWADLDVLEFRRLAHRADPGTAKLVVPVSLHRRQAELGAAPDHGGM
jgi:hypothetical protein